MSQHICYLFLPMIFANIAHMYVVKLDLWPAIKIPLHRSWFGENKTFRGFIVVTLFSAIFTVLMNTVVGSYSLIAANNLGLLLGFTYTLSELPNSFLKRRLGIPAGGKSIRFTWFFILLDRLDSSLGVVLVYCLYLQANMESFIQLVLLAISVHFVFSALMVSLGVKKEL